MIEGFKRRLSWHGVTPESNPSGGNKLRGLYNIVLKSLGAAHKKDPRTRIDAAIDYAEPMDAPGFYFMNSPGNDLEGIAGQVGAGCNLIMFVTGNGSVTNFPFVPTLKVTTTTGRRGKSCRTSAAKKGCAGAAALAKDNAPPVSSRRARDCPAGDCVMSANQLPVADDVSFCGKRRQVRSRRWFRQAVASGGSALICR